MKRKLKLLKKQLQMMMVNSIKLKFLKKANVLVVVGHIGKMQNKYMEKEIR
tara:strand:- start:266 stop:418 length:153 start_codon:yes stop_codon:yes gene_type:complete